MSTVAIIQPSFLPWVGYFQIIASCDHFIFYDDVQYDRRGWRNRNQIYSSDGPQWITVPVKSKGLYHQKINETQIDYSTPWIKKTLNSIKHSYGRSEHFGKYFPWLEDKLNLKHEFISDLDIALCEDISRFLEIKTEFHRSSHYPRPQGTNRLESLVYLCKTFGATTYISGPSASTYIGTDPCFDQENIKLKYAQYIVPEDGPRSHLSIIDYIFRFGEHAKKYTNSLHLVTSDALNATEMEVI